MPVDLETQIITDRLLLTPLVEGDAEEMFTALADPALGRFTGDEPPPSVAALRVRYAVLAGRRAPGGDDLWLNWIARRDGRAIGYVQATVGDETAWLAWVISTEHQGLGYATEAAGAMAAWLVEELQVTRLCASIFDEHEASRRVAAKLGLTPTDEFEEGERIWSRVGWADRSS